MQSSTTFANSAAVASLYQPVAGFAIHERFGKLPMSQIPAPAVDYAKEGFPVSPVIAYYLDRSRIYFNRTFAGKPWLDNIRDTSYAVWLYYRFNLSHRDVEDTFFIDEVFVKINDKQHYLQRAVDQDGEVVNVFLQVKRDGATARRLFKRPVYWHGLNFWSRFASQPAGPRLPQNKIVRLSIR